MITKRSSGILLHISSLPGKYGIGTLGQSAYDFVDFLEKAGQSYWQILPLGSTGYGDSPYQSFSAFDGNTDLIDLESLIDLGLLTEIECRTMDFDEAYEKVNYEKVVSHKIKLLKQAYSRIDLDTKESILNFREENKYWIETFGLFMTLKEIHNYQPWFE